MTPESQFMEGELARMREKRKVAHGWVASLVQEMLGRAEASCYAEYTLLAPGSKVIQLLEHMGLEDMYIRPGQRLGSALPIEWKHDDPNKCGLYFGGSLIVPPEPDRAYIATSSGFPTEENAVQLVAVGQEYKCSNVVFQQLTGIAARQDGRIEAVQLSYGEDTRGVIIFKDEATRTITYGDTWTFVDRTRDLLDLPR